MATRSFEDDPTILGGERLLRRIPLTWVVRDEQGNAALSSPAFKDEELSINLESTMARGARRPEDCIRLYPGYGLAAITASHARSLQQAVARDPLPEEPAHGVAYGRKKQGGIAGKLRDGAVWVVVPNQPRV